MAAEIRPDSLNSPTSSLASAAASSPISGKWTTFYNEENQDLNLTVCTGDDFKPDLLHKIEGITEEVHAAVLIPDMDGVISISSDR